MNIINMQLILSLISGLFIGGIAGYLGTLMLSKKMTIVADPLSHLAFPGVALALIWGCNISWGVFPFVILGAVIIWWLEERTKLPMENLAAIIFAIGVGTALLFLPVEKAEEALIGTIDQISLPETIMVILLSLLVFWVINQLYQKMMLININEDLATIEGIKVSKNNLLYLLSVAVVIALGVYLVGGLITAALIAIPAATAKNVSKSLQSYKIWAMVLGMISAVLGIVIAHLTKLPTGPMVVVTNAVLFLISMVLIKKQFN